MCLESRELQTPVFTPTSQCVKQPVWKDTREWWGLWQTGDYMPHLKMALAAQLQTCYARMLVQSHQTFRFWGSEIKNPDFYFYLFFCHAAQYVGS